MVDAWLNFVMNTALIYGNPPPAKELAAMEDCRWILKTGSAPATKNHRRSLERWKVEDALRVLRTTKDKAILDQVFSSNGHQVEESPDSPKEEYALPPDVVLRYLKQMETVPRLTYEKANFEVGMIVEAPLHEEDFMYGESLRTGCIHRYEKDRSISASHYGLIHTKLRKFIVVALHSRHYVAIPLYSHNQDGLSKVPEKDEFVSVHDVRNGEEALQQSNHEPLIAYTRPECSALWRQTTAHLVYPVSRNYNLRITRIGSLDADSTDLLLKQFRSCLGYQEGY